MTSIAPRLRAVLAASAILVALPAPGRAAPEEFAYVRVLELSTKGAGIWTGKFTPPAGEGAIAGVAVVADWWNGPGDPRAGDDRKSAATGIVFKLRHGEIGPVALAAASRDLRLMARAEAPADGAGLLAKGAEGDWTVQQEGGGDFPNRLRLEFNCRGDPLTVKDLRVQSIMLPGLDPRPVVGHEYIPDRTENPTLKPGAEIHAVVVVENCGARRTKEVDLDLLAVPFGKRQGKRLGFAQVPALEPGKSVELKIDGKIPEDLSKDPGSFEVLAFVNPRNAEREVESFNNALGRGFRYEGTPKKEGMPGDLKDR